MKDFQSSESPTPDFNFKPEEIQKRIKQIQKQSNQIHFFFFKYL